MKIKEGIFDFDYWNENIFPFVGTKLKDITDEFPRKFLVYGQHMGAYVLDTETNKKYYISAWIDNTVEISEVVK